MPVRDVQSEETPSVAGKFDVPDAAETGWLDTSKSTIQSKRADERFL